MYSLTKHYTCEVFFVRIWNPLAMYVEHIKKESIKVSKTTVYSEQAELVSQSTKIWAISENTFPENFPSNIAHFLVCYSHFFKFSLVVPKIKRTFPTTKRARNFPTVKKGPFSPLNIVRLTSRLLYIQNPFEIWRIRPNVTELESVESSTTFWCYKSCGLLQVK